MARPTARVDVPRPPFWFKLSIRMGNLLQVDGLILGCALLIAAAHTHTAAAWRVLLMIAGWLGLYFNSHALAHWLIGRLGRIRFAGYGVRGTDHPEVYPPGLRQALSSVPMVTAITDEASLRKARPWARALMFAAGETATALVGLLAGLYAWISGAPGGVFLFGFAAALTLAGVLINSRIPKGDYVKARMALARPGRHGGRHG